MNKLSILKKGIITENPVLVFLLGMCPALAVTTQASNAIGMGLATTVVLFCANTLISLLRGVIPDRVRIPCFIIIISGFVTFVQMFVKAYIFALDQALGIFLPLITANCLIFARGEMFAKKNKVIDSMVDAIAMGLGFTLALLAIAALREVFGSGMFFGLEIPVLVDNNIPLMTMAPGGFIAFGIIIAIVNKVSKKNREHDCASCPASKTCASSKLKAES